MRGSLVDVPLAAVAAAVLLSIACAPPRFSAGAQIEPARLYALSGTDAQVTLLDGASGRTLGQPLSVGLIPHHLVAGPSGALLVAGRSGVEVLELPGPSAPAARRTWPATAGEQVRIGRPVPLEDGARPRLAAADGAGNVLVAYDVEPLPVGGGRCRVAVVDVSRAAVAHTHWLCAEGETITGLAAQRTPTGTIAYAALWRAAQGLPAAVAASGAAPDSGTTRPASARIVSIDASTGAVLGVTALHGQPRPVQAGGSLLLVPGPTPPPTALSPVGPAPLGPRLYAVEALPGPVWATWNEEEYAWAYRLSASWRLTALGPAGLTVESSVALDFAPSGLAMAPDGAHAYAFDTLDDRLVEVALGTGRSRMLAVVPGSGAVPAGLAVSAERVYAAAPRRDEVWAFDRRTGRRVLALSVGRFPVALVALAAAEPVPAGGAPGTRPRP